MLLGPGTRRDRRKKGITLRFVGKIPVSFRASIGSAPMTGIMMIMVPLVIFRVTVIRVNLHLLSLRSKSLILIF